MTTVWPERRPTQSEAKIMSSILFMLSIHQQDLLVLQVNFINLELRPVQAIHFQDQRNLNGLDSRAIRENKSEIRTTAFLPVQKMIQASSTKSSMTAVLTCGVQLQTCVCE